MKHLITLTIMLFLTGTVMGANASKVENVSLQLDIDASQTFIDGAEVTEGVYTDLDYPYIVSEQPAGIVSYAETNKINYSSTSGVENYSINQQTPGSFLLPYTIGGADELESERRAIKRGTFLSQIEPSFSFFKKSTPKVRVAYSFPYSVESSFGTVQGGSKIIVRNKLNTPGTALTLETN